MRCFDKTITRDDMLSIRKSVVHFMGFCLADSLKFFLAAEEVRV